MPQDPATPDSAAQPAAAAETPAHHVAEVQKKKNLYLRLTSSMPLVVTVLVHVLLVGVAGAIVVQQNIGGKKKTFEATAANESAAQQVEHRLQVARRGGASGGASSPVSANRIYSTAAGALAMPEIPDLPSMGAGGFGGFGGMGSGVGLGAGTGMATSLSGGTGLGGRGFMSLSFLGSTSQNASKVVFVVDTSVDIMEPRKGGFRAFTIIREEIMRLVGRLPPSAQFNVVLYSYNSGALNNNVMINAFERELVAATSDNKKDFFTWIAPVNTKLGAHGPRTATRYTPLTARPYPEGSGIDKAFLPPVWARPVLVALEQKPDIVYVITATQGRVRVAIDADTLKRRREELEKRRARFAQDMKEFGLDAETVLAARERAFAKARAELDALNTRLESQNKEPIIIRWIGDLERADVQAAIRKAGGNIRFDRTGWSDRDGRLVSVPDFRLTEVEESTWPEFYAHYARVQRLLVPERPILNIFLFVGPDEKPESAITNLTAIAKRNGGTFEIITTKRLEEIKGREEAAAKK